MACILFCMLLMASCTEKEVSVFPGARLYYGADFSLDSEKGDELSPTHVESGDEVSIKFSVSKIECSETATITGFRVYVDGELEASSSFMDGYVFRYAVPEDLAHGAHTISMECDMKAGSGSSTLKADVREINKFYEKPRCSFISLLTAERGGETVTYDFRKRGTEEFSAMKDFLRQGGAVNLKLAYKLVPENCNFEITSQDTKYAWFINSDVEKNAEENSYDRQASYTFTANEDTQIFSPSALIKVEGKKESISFKVNTYNTIFFYFTDKSQTRPLRKGNGNAESVSGMAVPVSFAE